ncbi:hypothetical protein AWENTII_004188 [Aspergillus wentii]
MAHLFHPKAEIPRGVRLVRVHAKYPEEKRVLQQVRGLGGYVEPRFEIKSEGNGVYAILFPMEAIGYGAIHVAAPLDQILCAIESSAKVYFHNRLYIIFSGLKLFMV